MPKVGVTKKLTGLASKLKQKAGGPPHVIVSARPGTGKTTTLCEGLKYCFKQKPSIKPSKEQKAVWDQLQLSFQEGSPTVAASSFGKEIVESLKSKLPRTVYASTAHSLGRKAVANNFPQLQLDNNLTQELCLKRLGWFEQPYLDKRQRQLVNAAVQLIGLCKNNLIGIDLDTMDKTEDYLDTLHLHIDLLADEFAINIDGMVDKLQVLIESVLDQALEVEANDNRIDFNDMIWLPLRLKLKLPKYDLFMIDESQDLNRCQQELLLKCGHRLFVFGDPFQSIYGFSGADQKSVERLHTILASSSRNCVELPLLTTRRCSKAVVKESNKIVPSFFAHKSNPEGEVATHYFHKMLRLVKAGDKIISRTNATLVSTAIRLGNQGTRCVIKGGNFFKRLENIINNTKAENMHDLAKGVIDWRDKTIRTLQENDASVSRILITEDIADCILNCMVASNTVQGVINKLRDMFSSDDVDDNDCVQLMSIHRSKGLEAGTVWFLQLAGGQCPHPSADTPKQMKEEQNLLFVGITRAINNLYYVIDDPSVEGDT